MPVLEPSSSRSSRSRRSAPRRRRRVRPAEPAVRWPRQAPAPGLGPARRPAWLPPRRRPPAPPHLPPPAAGWEWVPPLALAVPPLLSRRSDSEEALDRHPACLRLLAAGSPHSRRTSPAARCLCYRCSTAIAAIITVMIRSRSRSRRKRATTAPRPPLGLPWRAGANDLDHIGRWQKAAARAVLVLARRTRCCRRVVRPAASSQPLRAAMYGEKIRGGNRGGHDRFNWDDVKNDKFRCASIDPCPCAHR